MKHLRLMYIKLTHTEWELSTSAIAILICLACALLTLAVNPSDTNTRAVVVFLATLAVVDLSILGAARFIKGREFKHD